MFKTMLEEGVMKRVPFFALLLLLPGFVAAQQLVSEQSDVTSPPADEPIEEITVYGEQPLVKLKVELEHAESSFYNLYNQLNDDWKFDVVCRKEAPTGSHIKRQICWPRYQLEARSQEAMAKLRRGYIDPAADATAMAMSKELRDRIAALAEEDPKLLQALVNYRDKFVGYRQERVRRCSESVLPLGCPKLDD
jgi:hypothetical protein